MAGARRDRGVRRHRGRLRGRGPAVLAVALAAGAACGGRAAAPTPEPLPRVVAVAAPGATTMALALVFPGSGWELPGTEGLTFLTARTLLEQVGPALAQHGARAEVVCDRAAFTFTLVVPRERWERASTELLGALFRPSPTQEALDRARDRLRADLAMDASSPSWQARLAIRQALYGDSLRTSAWTAPACGVPELLPLFDLARVRAAALRFAPRLAHAAVVGPIDPDSAVARLVERIPAADGPPLPGPGAASPGRRYAERNTITAWLSVALPFAAGADVEALRLLGALLLTEVGPHVTRPDVLVADYELERHGDGGALIVHMVTAPGAAARYADRIEARVTEIARVGVSERVWVPALARHQGRRLLDLEAPESRAAAVALSLALDVKPVDGWPDPGSLTPARVGAAAASLGPAARSVVGPRSARDAIAP